jgi:hypothetical protein
MGTPLTPEETLPLALPQGPETGDSLSYVRHATVCVAAAGRCAFVPAPQPVTLDAS